MSEVVYRSRVQLTRHRGVHRSAMMPAGERVEFGVHGAVAEHYGVSMDVIDPVSTTHDYVVAAAAG